MKYSLKAIRINKGETQEEAAKKIGISVETLANYERGITYPDIPILKKIEEHYQVNYNDIDFFCNDITVKQNKRGEKMKIECTPSELKELLNSRKEIAESRIDLKNLLKENTPVVASTDVNSD